jgi:CheY-like chemotaxis protein
MRKCRATFSITKRDGVNPAYGRNGIGRAQKGRVSKLQTEPIDERSFVKHRLLVAEDDKALRGMIVEILRSDGHEVVTVANGMDLRDTLEVSLDRELGAGKFDLVISDVRMPGMTGLRAFEEVGYGPDIPPVVFITAFGDEELHEQAHHLGALAVLDKPFDLDEFRSFVNSYLSCAGATR